MPNSFKLTLNLEAEFFFQQGLRRNRVQEFEVAIANLDTALRCKPDYPEAWFQKGFALGSLGRHEDAIACFDEMLKLRSNDSWVWHMSRIFRNHQKSLRF